MMKVLGVFAQLSLVLLISAKVFAQVDGVEYDWELKRDKVGIKVFTSPVKGSKYKAVRAEMQVKASVNSLVGLVFDSAACPKWADLCKEQRLVEAVSPSELYVYVYNDIPFPVKDRDVLAHLVWEYDSAKKKVTMSSTATVGRLDKTKAVRIENAVANWHFTALGDGETLVENFAHIDPNGPTPAWVTNLLLVDSPFKTLKRMRKIVESGKYAEYQPEFIPLEAEEASP